jgi:putative ABC transport system ATP-binding protein
VTEIVRLDNVSKEYPLGAHKVQALKSISFSVEAGVLLAIAGPSGSGKSTLLNLIGQIDVPTSGRVFVAGQDISGRTPDELAEMRLRTVGFIFQSFNLFPVLTAEENIEYPLLQMPEVKKQTRRNRVGALLELVGLERFARHRPSQLSGGQRQRVAIARALVTRPKIVLADEPTANLDHKTGSGILTLMKELNKKMGTTFIFSTHDQKVLDFADHYVGMEDGELRFLGIRKEGQWLISDDRRKGERRKGDRRQATGAASATASGEGAPNDE